MQTASSAASAANASAENAAGSKSAAESSATASADSATAAKASEDAAAKSAAYAEQCAANNGYMQMGVDPDTGHLMYTRTTNLKDKIDFAIVNDTNLEVQIHG